MYFLSRAAEHLLQAYSLACSLILISLIPVMGYPPPPALSNRPSEAPGSDLADFLYRRVSDLHGRNRGFAGLALLSESVVLVPEQD